MFSLVKEEPVDQDEFIHQPQLTASFNIVRLENPHLKTFNISGLSNVLNQNSDISIRTDLKELKITTKINNKHSAIYTKDCQLILPKRTYAVKLSRETGKAYFVPINSIHSISFFTGLDESSKSVDTQNQIFEDSLKMPNPLRNKHDQLCVEMKNYLYKPLKRVVTQDAIKKFMDQLFNFSSRRSFNSGVQVDKLLTNRNRKPDNTEVLDIVQCPYWHLKKINLCDIKKIDNLDIKIELFLRKVQLIRFEEILLIFNVDDYKLLNILNNICYLIRGNWVIKSHLLYKSNNHDTQQQQLLIKNLKTAREYLLWIFATNKLITVGDVFEKFKNIPGYEEILDTLTIRNGSSSIIDFKLPEDLHFIQKYSSLAQKQHEKTKELLSRTAGTI